MKPIILWLLGALAIAYLSTASLAHTKPAPANHELPDTTPCKDSAFAMQTNFWVNLHLFLRAESRRRHTNAPPEMPIRSLTPAEQSAWTASLNAYDGIAKLNPLFDPGLIALANTLAQTTGMNLSPSDPAEPAIIQALNAAAPIYRDHLWPVHRKQDEDWIATHCSDIQRYDRQAKEAIAATFRVNASSQPILVDLARENGRTLAYTTEGPPGTAGHTILAPQKNAEKIEALNTILHEISHTMVDNAIIEALQKEAGHQHVTIPNDLWHALTLYTTAEITERLIAHEYANANLIETERTAMFEPQRMEPDAQSPEPGLAAIPGPQNRFQQSSGKAGA